MILITYRICSLLTSSKCGSIVIQGSELSLPILYMSTLMHLDPNFLSFLLINSFQFLKILYINIYTHTHIHTYTYLYIHTYTHIHTHIHIHIYIYISYVIVRIKVPQCSIPILLGHIKLVFTLSSVNSNYPNTQISMLP